MCICGKRPRPGQRDCRECHAKAERRRRKTSAALAPAEKLNRAMAHIARPRGAVLPEELRVKLRKMAERAAAEIELFNRSHAGER